VPRSNHTQHTELKEVAGGASAQTHFDEGVQTKTQLSSPESFLHANAVNDKDHYVS
jgi:hypothetical protein